MTSHVCLESVGDAHAAVVQSAAAPPVSTVFSSARWLMPRWLTLALLPLCALLVVARLAFIVVYWIPMARVLPRALVFSGAHLRAFCLLAFGIWIRRRAWYPLRPDDVVVMNHLSHYDALSLLDEARHAQWVADAGFLNDPWIRALMPFDNAIAVGEGTLEATLAKVDPTRPLSIYPEGVILGLRSRCLLRFASFAFSLDRPVSPRVIRYRGLIPWEFNTYRSERLIDFLVSLATPLRVCEVECLPRMERRPEESVRAFADRVHRTMADRGGLRSVQAMGWKDRARVRRTPSAWLPPLPPRRLDVVFDFDGTLHSGNLWGAAYAGAPPLRRALLLLLAPFAWLASHVSSVLTNNLILAAAGEAIDAAAVGAYYAARVQKTLISRLTEHLQRGDQVRVLTASPRRYVAPFLAEIGVRDPQIVAPEWWCSRPFVDKSTFAGAPDVVYVDTWHDMPLSRAARSHVCFVSSDASIHDVCRAEDWHVIPRELA